MDARELRMGNLFVDKQTQTIINVIGLTENIITFSGHFKNDWKAEPIPLTEEWLLKFGFEMIEDKTEEVWYWAYKDFVLEPTFFCFGYASPIVFDLIRVNEENPLIYVHQLQNIYFALTGEELEIKL
jgi:hypothetical protein